MPCCMKGNKYEPNKKQNNNSTVKLTSFSKLPSIRKKEPSKNKKDSLSVQFNSNLSKSKSKKVGCLG